MPEQRSDDVVYKVRGKEASGEPDLIRLSSIQVTNQDVLHFRSFDHLERIYYLSNAKFNPVAKAGTPLLLLINSPEIKLFWTISQSLNNDYKTKHNLELQKTKFSVVAPRS